MSASRTAGPLAFFEALFGVFAAGVLTSTALPDPCGEATSGGDCEGAGTAGASAAGAVVPTGGTTFDGAAGAAAGRTNALGAGLESLSRLPPWLNVIALAMTSTTTTANDTATQRRRAAVG